MSGLRKVADTAIAFDGQSINLIPDTAGDSYPAQLMRRLSPSIRWANCAVGGASWADLAAGTGPAAGQPASTRLFPQIGQATTAVLILSGGQEGIIDGLTAEQVWDDNVAYATAAKAAGFTYVINTTMPIWDDFWDPPLSLTVRSAVNALILANDSAGAIDAVVEATGGVLDDPSGPGFNIDLLHLSTVGAAALADLVEVELAAALA